MNEQFSDTLTVVVCGAAGVGTRELGMSVSQVLARRGYEVFASVDYPSLIRGGHNFSRITFSRGKVYNDHTAIDMLLTFDEKSVPLHAKELKEDALVLGEHFAEEDAGALGTRAVTVPMTAFAEELQAPAIMRTSAMLGAFAYTLQIPFEVVAGVLQDTFRDKGADTNIALAEKGYRHAEANGVKHANQIEPNEGPRELLNGSTTCGLGMVAAGLDMYIAYPMTPASPILHYLAKEQKGLGIKVIHPENELSAINMSLGVAYAGKRVATGTAGGGFALMQEAFSFAGVSETPVLVIISQRQAPGTGVPTYTAQADLRFAVHAGHGEFPRIVLAPGDAEEAYYCAADGLNLAWKYQTPVLVLMDKHLAESVMTGSIDPGRVQVERGVLAEQAGEGYKRYAFTESGVSPMAFPGTPGAIVKMTSYEHDEDGITTEDMATVKAMQEKRFRKTDLLPAEYGPRGAVRVYGDRESKKVIVFWGSTKAPVLEAAKYMQERVKLVQIVWVEPLDANWVRNELGDAEVIVDVEANHDGQLAGIIREKTGIHIEKKVLRYDSRPFEPLELARELDNLVK